MRTPPCRRAMPARPRSRPWAGPFPRRRARAARRPSLPRPSGAPRRAPPPARAVEPAHGRVFGVAGLLADADPGAGGPHGMDDRTRPARDAQARVGHAEAEVRVLAVGVREALVEAVQALEHASAVG